MEIRHTITSQSGGRSATMWDVNFARALSPFKVKIKKTFGLRPPRMDCDINSNTKRTATHAEATVDIDKDPNQLTPEEGGVQVPKDSFHSAIAPILLLAQLFGLMPVNGILNRDLSQQEFRWTSFRTIYTLFCCVSLAFSALVVLAYNLTKKITIESFVSFVFYAANTTIIISFLFLARKWPKLIAKWTEVEAQLQMPISQIAGVRQREHRMWYDWKLSTKVRLITGAILCLSTVEHSFSILRYFYYAETCPNVKETIKSVFIQHFTEFFSFTTFTWPKAIWTRFLLAICVFAWSYMDCFVSIVSVGISSGFYRINSQMRLVKGMNLPEEFWKQQRRNYRSLCELCELVDDHISHLTLTSFTNNLFFICFQLQNSMEPRPSLFLAFYFWFSLFLLIGRTLAVILFSAQINVQSRGPVEFIHVAPGQSWCLELERFHEEVASDTIALTGLKFFNLTRKVVLSVAATIVTYELVLIQLRSQHESTNEHCEEIYYERG